MDINCTHLHRRGICFSIQVTFLHHAFEFPNACVLLFGCSKRCQIWYSVRKAKLFSFQASCQFVLTFLALLDLAGPIEFSSFAFLHSSHAATISYVQVASTSIVGIVASPN